ncbi:MULTISPECIES: hypothetical protein [unclassified Luteibacter]|uniref:hypothetical protein n=1 Tax=Luteibacter sp. PvP019 TaxID=3156436 RepID=UPI003394AE6B
MIRRPATSLAAAAITEASVMFGDRLSLETLPESLETDGQRLHLLNLGCTSVNGFLRGRLTEETATKLPLFF